MGKSCRDMAIALQECMMEGECMADGTRSLKECLKMNEYQHECQSMRLAYFECKRGQLDMRTRIRGPKGGVAKPDPSQN